MEIGEETPSPADVSIVFAIDSGYVDILKVCLHSLILSGNFIDCPVVIYSLDQKIFEDRVLSIVADRTILLEGPRRDTLHQLAETSVQHRNRLSWNHGTFLKWAIFEKQETSRAIFLDADMIFLRNFDQNIMNEATAPFSCCPQFRQSMVKNEHGAIRSESDRSEEIKSALAGSYSGKLTTNVNSGVMVLGPELLDKSFFDEMVTHASEKKEVNEQLHFTSYFKKHPNLMKMMPAKYNFQENYLIRLNWENQHDFLKKIHVLHYAGRPKPWSSLPKRADFRPSSALWHWHRSISEGFGW
ncbi:glycosyltransferase [Limimaricola cinnabarinus]|uniref:glycosyltransferase n=1 Tax=Limimaricola cinnabarinus TaxID=1125964 RepID=UPI0024903EC3|nr:glycosyltransferase [Limimaricola cinnabarinus]